MSNPVTWFYVLAGWIPAAFYMSATGDTEGWEIGLGIYVATCLFFYVYSASGDRLHERAMREIERAKQEPR